MVVMRFRAKKKADRRLPKSAARFPAKKRWHSPPPRRVVLELPPPPPESVRAGGARTLTSHQNFSDR